MNGSGSLFIRNVELDGRSGLDLLVQDGRIVSMSPNLSGPLLRHVEAVIDADGGAIIPGLIDHHIHLFALAAQKTSLALDTMDPAGPAGFVDYLSEAGARLGQGAWLRVTGYDESMGGALDRHALDRIVPHNPVRVLHRTGALWVFNSRALAALLADNAYPPSGLEMQDGEPTGRLFRGDGWLAERLGSTLPDLSAVGEMLARFGVTSVTDASATTDDRRAEALAQAHRSGALPQRLTLMSAGPLAVSADGAYGVGPVKLLLDDSSLPDFDDTLDVLKAARMQGRALAVHCVTAAELAFTLALFESGGALPGDRIEHGGVVHPAAVGQLAQLGVTVVTQPNFIHDRGDRYLSTVDAEDLPALYPCGSLLARGVQVAAGSDAPYGSPDPWLAIRAAYRRRTRNDQVLGDGERIDPRRALGLYLGDANDPGGAERKIAIGALADLCLLDRPLDVALAAPSSTMVRATVIGGAVVYDRAVEACGRVSAPSMNVDVQGAASLQEAS